MSKLTHQVTINASVDKVWEILADFGAIDKWAPPVSKSYSTTEANGGVGAGRHCDTSFGALKEQIVEWEEGRSFTIDGKTILPMKYARNGFSVSPATWELSLIHSAACDEDGVNPAHEGSQTVLGRMDFD